MSNSEKPPSIRKRAPIPKDQCPMALAAGIIGDKWTLLILREAFYGVQRYDDMRQDTGAPRAMLTDRLNKLVAHGILRRHPYKEDGDRVRFAYALTEAGAGLAHTMMALTQWGETFVAREDAPVQLIEKKTGQSLRVEFVSADGRVIQSKNAGLVVR
jgi:DNA-binding HxlR family transcriptional regulator